MTRAKGSCGRPGAVDSGEGAHRVDFLHKSGEPTFAPPSDVHETAEGLVVRIELPGVPLEKVEVWVKGHVIEVTGEKRPSGGEEAVSFLRMERAFGRFHRVFEVTGCFNRRDVTAVIRNGVLTLTVPRVKERRNDATRVPVIDGDEPRRQ